MKGVTNLNIKDVEIKFAKYRITKFDIIIPGYDKPYSLNQAHIGNWTIEKDYENYVFPYMEFRVIVPDDVYSDILAQSENVYVDLKIEYGLFDDIHEMNPDQVLYSYGTILDNRFYAFIDNRSPKLTDSTIGNKEDEKRDGNDLTQYSYDNKKALVMALYRADHIFYTNQIVNAVLSGATTADAMAYYIKTLGLKNVLMSPADNSKIYDQLALAPLPAIKGMLRTINTYQLHTAGTTLFFDYDTIYILNKKLGATAWIPNEIKTIYLASFPSSADNSTMKSGFYVNSKERYGLMTIVGNSINISNESMFSDQVAGGNMIAIDSNTGKVSTLSTDLKVSDMSPSKTGKANRVVTINTGNGNTLQGIKSSLEQAQATMTVVMENVNIRALAPNKDFIFTTDNPNYTNFAGHYRILNMTSTFTKESELYTCFNTSSFVGGAATV